MYHIKARTAREFPEFIERIVCERWRKRRHVYQDSAFPGVMGDPGSSCPGKFFFKGADKFREILFKMEYRLRIKDFPGRFSGIVWFEMGDLYLGEAAVIR